MFAICEHWNMPTDTLYALLKAIGVSPAYASQIAHGRRVPSLALAIRIYRRTGIKLGPIAKAGRAEIARLERLRTRRLTP